MFEGSPASGPLRSAGIESDGSSDDLFRRWPSVTMTAGAQRHGRTGRLGMPCRGEGVGGAQAGRRVWWPRALEAGATQRGSRTSMAARGTGRGKQGTQQGRRATTGVQGGIGLGI